MMAGPPGEPTEARKPPSLSNTMVGDMADSGSLPGAGALATGLPSRTGWKEKSVSVLLSMKPLVMISAPNTDSTEVVMAITSAVASTMVRWLVSCTTGETCDDSAAWFGAGLAGVYV